MNAAEKVYVIDNSFLNIFAYPKQDYGVENAVACLLHRQWGKVFYWRDKNEHEVDFIYERQQGDYLPVEVKYASGRPEQQELKGLARFCEDYKCKSAFVVTKDYFAFHEGVWNVPAWLFCLVF